MKFYDEDQSQINQSYLLRKHPRAFLFTRATLFVIASTIWWLQIYDNETLDFLNVLSNLKFLTLVGLTLAVSYYFLALLDMLFTRNHTKKHLSIESTIWSRSIWKLEHYLFQASFSVSLTIALLFWVGVYHDLSPETKENSYFMGNTILRHGGVLLTLYVELAINTIPFRWKQLPLIYALLTAYLVVNLVVTLTSEPVYPVMTWKSLASYLFLVAAGVVVLVHFSFAKWVFDKYKADYVLSEQSVQTSATNLFTESLNHPIKQNPNNQSTYSEKSCS